MSIPEYNGPRMVKLLWPNGSTDVGPKYVELFDRLMSKQWRQFVNRTEFKQELARRAVLWSGTVVEVDDTNSREFFLELGRAGMVRVYENNEEVTPFPTNVVPFMARKPLAAVAENGH